MPERHAMSLGALAVLAVAAALLLYHPTDRRVACTMEVKLCPDGSAVGRTGPRCEFAACPDGTAYRDLIRVMWPVPDAVVGSPLTVRGEARGTWFFEASFPIRLLDGNDNQIMVVPARTQGDWMTTEFVPFEATLIFGTTTTQTGTLVFQKDNPSGLPENADSMSVPIRFKNVMQ